MAPPFPTAVCGGLRLFNRLLPLLLSATAVGRVGGSRPSGDEGVAVGAKGRFQLAQNAQLATPTAAQHAAQPAAQAPKPGGKPTFGAQLKAALSGKKAAGSSKSPTGAAHATAAGASEKKSANGWRIWSSIKAVAGRRKKEPQVPAPVPMASQPDQAQEEKPQGQMGEERKEFETQCSFEDLDLPDKIGEQEQKLLLGRLQLCLKQIGEQRKETVGKAQDSARMNMALQKQYRKLVDMANIINAQGGPQEGKEQVMNQEEYEAMDRREEAKRIDDKIHGEHGINAFRRQLWLPAWKAKGLWPEGFEEEPQRVLGEMRLPYLGDPPQRLSSTDRILSELDGSESVKMQRWMKSDRTLHARIKHLQEKLRSEGTLDLEELQELAGLEEKKTIHRYQPANLAAEKAKLEPRFRHSSKVAPANSGAEALMAEIRSLQDDQSDD